MNKNIKGFTLIELLVVVAIIGILSSVVLASLNSARTKGADAAIKSNLANMRAQAEMVFDGSTTGVYTGLCTNTVIAAQLASVASSLGGTVGATNALATLTTVTCHESSSAWAVQSGLKGGNYWCVDSLGASKGVTTALALNATVCPAS